MIFEGLKLSVLGMSVVFIFLIILVVLILLNSKLCKNATNKEIGEITSRPKVRSSSDDDEGVIAAIGAAIRRYRNK